RSTRAIGRRWNLLTSRRLVSKALEVVERLEAILAAVMRFARGRAELRDETRVRRSAARTCHRCCAPQGTDSCDVDARTCDMGWCNAEFPQSPPCFGHDPIGGPGRRER